VHANECLARFDGIDKCLFVRQRKIAGGIRKDKAVVFLEGLGCHFLRYFLVAAGVIHREIAALLRKFAQDFFRRGNGTVTKSLGDSHDQKLFGRGSLG